MTREMKRGWTIVATYQISSFATCITTIMIVTFALKEINLQIHEKLGFFKNPVDLPGRLKYGCSSVFLAYP